MMTGNWCDALLLEMGGCSFWHVKYINFAIFFYWSDFQATLMSFVFNFSFFFFYPCSLFTSFVSPLQRSVAAPLRMSLLVVSCPRATRLRMSTTCTVCGPLRLPLEALSGLNNTLRFPIFVLISFLITLFFSRHSFNLAPFNILSI